METENKTSFWDKKEGVWGLCGIGVIVALLGAFWAPISAAVGVGFMVLATTLGYGIAWGILGAIAFLLLYGLFIDGRLLKMIMLKYEVFITNLRKSIIDENPLTILKIWKEKADKRMADLRSQKDEVKKQENVVKKANNTFKNDFLTFQSQAKTLNGDQSKTQLFRSACGKMATAAAMVKKTSEQLETIKRQYLRIDEAYKDLEAMYSDMEYEEKTLIIDYEVSGALDKVWTSIRRIFKGENEEDRMREEAIESINKKYAERMGRVESAIDDCQGKMDEIKLQKEIRENDGIDMFNQLAGVSVDELTKPAIGYTPAPTIDAQFTNVSSYSNILKK